MKHTVLLFLLAAWVAAASAQTQSHPAANAVRPPAAAASTASAKPSGPPPVHGVVKTAFSLRYEDIKIGSGPLVEPNMIYKVYYTGWIASTGVEFDSTSEHRAPVYEKGKPVIGADGKTKLGPPMPIVFPQGFGRVIPGFDEGFAGMRVGGERRLFIPWQLGYGARSIPAHGPDHPGIPPKSDLIFDVTLAGVTNMPTFPMHPGIPAHPAAGAAPAPQHPGASPTVAAHPIVSGDAAHPAQKPANPAAPAPPPTK
jgi:peptidylprolyl isomerase